MYIYLFIYVIRGKPNLQNACTWVKNEYYKSFIYKTDDREINKEITRRSNGMIRRSEWIEAGI